MRTVLLLLLATALLGACATPADTEAGPDVAGTGGGGAASDLEVRIDRGDGTPLETYTLVCGEVVEGDHPEAWAACEHLANLDAPFEPLPSDAICTEQYGGPQTARVTGTWRGEPVDLQLSRTNGCAISQWDFLGPLLPGPVGVEPPG
jgi:hypothetical protein